MKTRMTTTCAARTQRAVKPALLAAGLAILALALPVIADRDDEREDRDEHRRHHPQIIPPHAKSHGHTYGEWGALWYRWAFSIPFDQNPVVDTTGEFAAIGQSGPVWFLAGTFGGAATRTVTVPAGKALFFPIIDTAWITTCVGEPRTIADALPLVQPFIDAATGLAVWIDGVPVRNLGQYRASSPLFCTSLTLLGIITVEDLLASGFCATTDDYNPNCTDLPNPDEHFGPADGFGPAIADGYWLMLAPLKVGPHTIRIKAASDYPTIGAFSLDVTYHLTVKK